MSSRSPYLDILRGLAALSVVLLHIWLYADPVTKGSLSDAIFHELRLGLICFFVLSGFLLYLAWLSPRTPSLKSYASKRAKRILPAYYASMVGAFLVMGLLAPERLPAVAYWPLFVVLGQNYSPETLGTVNPPTWTLGIEVAFYVCLPLIGLAARRLPSSFLAQASVPVALILSGVLFNALTTFTGGTPRLLLFSLPANIFYFGFGMLAAVIYRYRPPLRHARVLVALGAGWVLGAAYLHRQSSFDVVSVFRDAPAAAGFALLALGLVCLKQGSRLKGLVWLGTISYGLYLWHMPLLIALSNLNLLPSSVPLAILVALPPCILLGALSFYFIEQPFLSSKKKQKSPSPRLAEARGW